MPNQNTAGVNQPLDQHPVPRNEIYSVAQDAAFFTGLMVASGDVLVVPPPVTGGARLVEADGVQALALGAGVGNAGVSLVYKDGGGNEIILATLAAVAVAADFGEGIVLMPDDLGLFLRVTSDPPAGSVSVFSRWDDVRNIVSRDNIELTTSFQDIIPYAPDGTTLFPGRFGEESDSTYGWVFNLDGADRDVEIQITDGTNTLLFEPFTVTTLTNQTLAAIGSRYRSTPELKFQARITTASADPVILQLPLSAHNQGPARQDQGGAF